MRKNVLWLLMGRSGNSILMVKYILRKKSAPDALLAANATNVLNADSETDASDCSSDNHILVSLQMVNA